VLSRDLSLSASSRAIRHSLPVDGVESIYFEYPATSDSAITLIMVHGYRGNHRGLEAIAAGLSKYRVIIPDLPGFGESMPLIGTHSVKAYSDWLHSFVTALGLEGKVHLMGHSFGTLVVGLYATEHSPRTISLVNPVSTPALEGPQAALTNLTKLYYLIATLAPRFAGEWLLRNKIAVMVMSVVMAKTKNRELRRWIHNQHLSNFSDFASVKVAVEGYDASISTDLSKLAAEITAPVLVVAATMDDITDIQAQRRVSKLYKQVTYREIEGVGHLVHYEAPQQAATFISQFLEELA
jgi:pimeloyl-ACP methyl ester carboxylesterase